MRLENGYMMITRLKVQREEPKPLRSQILVMKFGFHQILVNLTQVYDKALLQFSVIGLAGNEVASFAPESVSSLIVQESRTEQIAGFSEHRTMIRQETTRRKYLKW